MSRYSVTTPSDLHRRGTIGTPCKAKKLSTNNGLEPLPSRIGANVFVLPGAGTAALLAIINHAPAMTLRRVFAPEATSHRALINRGNAGTRTVHPDFRELRSFLRIVIDEIGRRPPGHTLDRTKNTDMEYAPGKVRWAAPKVQCRNRSTTIMTTTAKGKPVAVADIAEKRGLNPDTVRHRMRRGLSIEDATALAKGVRRPKFCPPADALCPAGKMAKTEDGASTKTEGLWRAWSKAWRETYPLAPAPVPWSRIERGQASTLGRRLELAKIDPVAFMIFAVCRWRQVIWSRLRWMDGCPAMPGIGFLAGSRRLEAFIDVFASEVERLAHQTLQGGDRILHELLAAGLGRDDALKETGRRMAKAALEDEQARRDAHYVSQIRALMAERKALAAQLNEARLRPPTVPALPAPGVHKTIRLVERPAMDHGRNPYENPEHAPDFTPVAFGAFEDHRLNEHLRQNCAPTVRRRVRTPQFKT